jgi:hypothetical protein
MRTLKLLSCVMAFTGLSAVRWGQGIQLTKRPRV